MRTSDFDYDLPPELIAQEPLPERTQSRMLVLHRRDERMEHRHVGDLPACLRAGDLLVVNDTRVIPARVFGQWFDSPGRIELLLLEEKAPGLWEAMLRSRRRPAAGMACVLARGALQGSIAVAGGGGRVQVRLTGDRPVSEILEEEGVPPVPPYIRRPREASPLVAMDRARYQTVYARVPGAVAAPTAGLHFSDELMMRLDEAGVRRAAVTLHVGPGTFKPVAVEEVENHIMEPERFDVTAEAAQELAQARRRGGRVVAVGSTTVRTLETAAGANGDVVPCSGRTSIFIRPPYRFKVVEAMLTNFHLPRSTLLMMVSAFAGKEFVRRAYQEAIRERYRFYSYGDCMLIL